MTETVVEQEKNFYILRNAGGDFMILIRARMNDADQPRVVYNGGEHAVLYRNVDSVVVLDFIHPSVREDLSQSEKLLVVETNDGSIIREYESRVTNLAGVPLPNNLVLE